MQYYTFPTQAVDVFQWVSDPNYGIKPVELRLHGNLGALPGTCYITYLFFPLSTFTFPVESFLIDNRTMGFDARGSARTF